MLDYIYHIMVPDVAGCTIGSFINKNGETRRRGRIEILTIKGQGGVTEPK